MWAGPLLMLSSQVTTGAQPTDLAYEALLCCYGHFLASKGFNAETPDKIIAGWDGRAKQHCQREYKRFERLTNPARTRHAWSELWGEYWSRD